MKEINEKGMLGGETYSFVIFDKPLSSLVG